VVQPDGGRPRESFVMLPPQRGPGSPASGVVIGFPPLEGWLIVLLMWQSEWTVFTLHLTIGLQMGYNYSI